MNNKLIIVAASCLSIGFLVAYFVFDSSAQSERSFLTVDTTDEVTETNDTFVVTEELSTSERLENAENDIDLIKQQLQHIEALVNDLSDPIAPVSSTERLTTKSKNRYTTAFNQRLYNIDSLISGGIDPGFAEDIVRRKNNIELKRLELQDYATRNDYLDTQRYIDELDEINRSDVSLRDELGDQLYDEYLFKSKQNNRVRINSVMLGSPAELAGIEKGDIVLSYEDNRMFTWQELKDATASGELGEYVSINIYRDGEIYSFSVPRGTLGVQLGAARLTP